MHGGGRGKISKHPDATRYVILLAPPLSQGPFFL